MTTKCLDKGAVIWLTGIPGSGKSTIASKLRDMLEKMGIRVEVLDGDWVRKTINPDAGFSYDERRKHLLRVAWIARLLARNGIIVVASFVSPYRRVRDEIRRIIEEEVPFVEVYVKCSLEEAIRRDPKGLYKKAIKGEIKHFTGVSDPYEEPLNPDLVLNTETNTVEQNVSKLINFIVEKKIIKKS